MEPIMSAMIDFDGINDAALRDGRSFVETLVPGGMFRGDEYIVRNPRRDDRHAGSFSINYRSGNWADFATGDRGADLVSLFAYVRGINDQADAAREMAAELGLSFLKSEYANGHRNGKLLAAAIEKPTLYDWGNTGPPVRNDEIRRHYYSVGGCAMKIKIKLRGEHRFTQWYRRYSQGVPAGWQAQRPINYVDTPYFTVALDPFDPELRGDEILWPEGEQDVDTLSKSNVPAFTFGGTGDGLPDGIAHWLKDRQIVILADNDEAGRVHAEEKAVVAHAAGAASVKIVHFLELPEKGDVSDFIEGGGTVDQLNAWIDAAPDWSPSGPRVADQHPPLSDRKAGPETGGITSPSGERSIVAIRANTLAIIAGDPGLGKSTVLIEIAALHSKGSEFPCGEGKAVQCESAILTAEDGLRDTLMPRLIAAEADTSKIHFLTGTKADDDVASNETAMFDISRDVPALRKFLKANQAVKVLIVDPLTAYLGSGTKAKENADVRRVLTPLVKLAEDFGLLLLANNHLNKSAGKALYRVLDSIAFVALGRVIHLVIEDSDNREIRKFICDKINIGSKPPGLTYFIQKAWIKGEQGEEIETSRIVWGTTTIDETADEALGTDDDTPTMADEAEKLLREILGKGRMVVQDIEAEARAAGMLGGSKEIRASKPFRMACERLGVIHEREGFGPGAKYYWRLP
jgi:AAA domain